MSAPEKCRDHGTIVDFDDSDDLHPIVTVPCHEWCSDWTEPNIDRGDN